ncbi:MAG: DUF1624 domain-containing protein [Gemmataceae bacterium]|nr:DUF1624 domain-containing protein [Gemmataceae bacterium]
MSDSSNRYYSVDAYRGFTMLAMISSGLGMSKLLLDPNWRWLADQFTHRDWIGCTFWDLIQPSFMFLVGVSMPLAFGLRQQRGETYKQQLHHALTRVFSLVVIGILLDSFGKNEPVIQFIRVLQQIALGYLVAFFTLRLKWQGQAGVAILCLAIHTALHLIHGGTNGNPWERNYNFGYLLDVKINDFFKGLGLPTLFPPSTGGYATTNAISAAATIIGGVLCGELLRKKMAIQKELMIFVAAGASLLLVGWGLSFCLPMVKKVWTASFGLFSLGWTFLMLAGFHAIIEGFGWRKWAFPLVVAGLNSIILYVSSATLGGPFRSLLQPFTQNPLSVLADWAPVVLAMLVVTCHWTLAYFLYRRGIFFKA